MKRWIKIKYVGAIIRYYDIVRLEDWKPGMMRTKLNGKWMYFAIYPETEQYVHLTEQDCLSESQCFVYPRN